MHRPRAASVYVVQTLDNILRLYIDENNKDCPILGTLPAKSPRRVLIQVWNFKASKDLRNSVWTQLQISIFSLHQKNTFSYSPFHTANISRFYAYNPTVRAPL